MEEIWKPVHGYEGLYEVSNLGRVKSLPRRTTHGGIMSETVSNANGYCYVGLSKNGVSKTRRVHKLVYEAFTGDICDGFDTNRTINHIDGDKTNNRLDNLERVTQSENQLHAFRLGLEKAEGRKVICLDTNEVFDSLVAAGRFTGSKSRNSGNLVERVCKGQRSHYRGYHFAFYDDYVSGTIPEYDGKFKKGTTKSLWRDSDERQEFTA